MIILKALFLIGFVLLNCYARKHGTSRHGLDRYKHIAKRHLHGERQDRPGLSSGFMEPSKVEESSRFGNFSRKVRRQNKNSDGILTTTRWAGQGEGSEDSNPPPIIINADPGPEYTVIDANGRPVETPNRPNPPTPTPESDPVDSQVSHGNALFCLSDSGFLLKILSQKMF